jgi:hypothetical protein
MIVEQTAGGRTVGGVTFRLMDEAPEQNAARQKT